MTRNNPPKTNPAKILCYTLCCLIEVFPIHFYYCKLSPLKLLIYILSCMFSSVLTHMINLLLGYSSHATPTSSPVRLAHQPTATPNTFSAIPNCFIGAVTNNTPTSNKLFPWQHEASHQTTAGLYAAYEIQHHQPTTGCLSAHGELYPTF